ncbi:MAG: glycoside hydrolase family 31 protein [Chloroflexota bacterium]|nr:glycoside hydrolase family 31 protein [Chloroflexota bacterium]
MNSENMLKTIRYLTPDNVLFSHRGRLKILILQLVARFLPGRFAIWLSLLDKEVLERQVQIKFGIRSLIPGSSGYDIPRLHLIVERQDWESLQVDSLLKIEQMPEDPPGSQEQKGSGLAIKPILDLLQRIDRDLVTVHGRIRINFLELDQTRTLTLALNDSSLSPSGSFFDVDIPHPVLDSILTGELDIISAFLRGRIPVGGDTGMVAHLVNALNPPATYPPSLDTPNAYVGLSDHPIDRSAINLENVFDLFGVPNRTATCVLRVDLYERRDNSFIFRARGYDIYRNRRMEMDHTYVSDDEMPFTEMTWRLDFFRADAYRVRLAAGSCVRDNVTPMITSDITDPQLEVTLEEHSDHYLLSTKALCLKIYREDFRTEVLDTAGRKVTEIGGRQKTLFSTVLDSFPTGIIHDNDSSMGFVVENFTIAPNEAIYGFGERFSTLNKRGQTVGLWAVDGLGNTSGRTYKNIPFFMSTAGYGVFVNHVLPMTFFVGNRSYVHNLLLAEGQELDYYFFYGPSLKEIASTYTNLTGKSPVPPKWSFGLWVSRISYDSQEQVLETARRLRDERYPADVINVDTNWFEGEWQCDWRFGQRFPDPTGMFRQLREQGLRVCLWQWPYVCEHLDIYKEAQEKGVLAEGGNFDMLLFKVRTIDMSNPEAVLWYQAQLKRLFELGAAAIKVDFGEHVRDYERYQGYSGREMHNLYPLLYNRAAFEVSREYFGRGVIWARSAYAGSQRYPVHWSGDNSSTFDNMLCSLRGGLSFGQSGFTFWSNDVGGFTGTPSDRLYVRWTQFGIFNSHMRLHGGGPRYREPWNYGEQAQDIFRRMLELRYRFLPYLYSEAHHSARAGLPVMRPLVYEFQDDPTTFNIEDEFLFGQAVLVAPILDESDERKIYFPAGRWADGWTGDLITGPCWLDYQADLERVPFFYRGGYAVPQGPVMQYVDELPLDPLTLHIVPDEDGRAGCTMIDDDETVNVSGLLRDGMFELQVGSDPRGLVLHIYTTEKIESLVCNGQEVIPQQVVDHHYTGELDI